ncbi:MAG: hypothetical protein EP313_08905 [Bacteroidetes bacterium]|nr:MAG: hypothetical protein EP313_08905 [Bacteroidota bacterium]
MIEDIINQILAEWNPIEVPDVVAKNEYRVYSQAILGIINDKKALEEYLENLLINIIGLDYDPSSKEQKNDLMSVVEKLFSLSGNHYNDT